MILLFTGIYCLWNGFLLLLDMGVMMLKQEMHESHPREAFDEPALFYFLVAKCMNPRSDKHFQRPGLIDLHCCRFLWRDVCIQSETNISKCKSQWMCIVSFFFGQMDASKPRQIVLSARAHGPALFYVCPARCIYLCPETFLNGRADRLAFYLFISGKCKPGASIHVQIRISECQGCQTCICLFLSSQVHPSVSR